MKILMVTVGSRGDVQPFVALGQGLKNAGHDVTLCTSERFEPFVRQHGLAYAYLNDDLVALLDTVEGRAAIEDMGNLFSGIKTAVKLLKQTGPITRALIRDGWEAASNVKPDLIVYHAKMGSAVHYGEKLNIPVMMAALYPQFVPTAAFPAIGFPTWKLGGWYNRLTYTTTLKIAGRIGKKYVTQWRTAHGLPAPPRGVDLLHTSGGEQIPVLHAYSPSVLPEPADWPAGVSATGFWFLDQPGAFEPPLTLEQFLDAGEPPVYVGFGSMAGKNPKRVTRIVSDALQMANVRGILASGWGGLEPGEVPEHIFALEKVPHDWLFPRVSAVVHHGGAGTTAAGLRAGRPTIICPFFGDQPFWGWRVHELGVGSAPIPQKKLTAEKLAAAIREVTTNATLRRNAESLAAQIQNEDGIASAINTIERLCVPSGSR